MKNALRLFARFVKKIPVLRNETYSKISYILGVETSCDDTGIAIIDGAGQIINEQHLSQTEISTKLGGVLPSIAADFHERNIDSLVAVAFRDAELNLEDLTCIAVTVKPGMPLSLKVGVSYSKSLASRLNVPIIPVHHMEAHALTVLLTDSNVKFPYLVLLLSGGHGLLAFVRDVDDFVLLGTALDASPGSILDKLARRLKLSRLVNKQFGAVSGGRAIELMAKTFNGNPDRFNLPLPRSQSRDCDFSFTGIHIAAEKFIKDRETSAGDVLAICDDVQFVADICASVQCAMTKLICRRVQRAIDFVKLKWGNDISQQLTALVLSGGVGANGVIRAGLEVVAGHYNLKFAAPPAALCTDNGVMVAWNGLLLYKSGRRIVRNIELIDFQPKVSFGLDFRDLVRQENMPIDVIKLPSTIFTS